MRKIALLFTLACAQPPPPAPAPVAHDKVDRDAFNRTAADLALPLFWRADANANKQLDPTELAVAWGMDDTTEATWLKDGKFTPAFEDAYAAVAKRVKDGLDTTGIDADEVKRRKLLLEELSQNKPTLVESSFRADPAAAAFVKQILVAAKHIERLYNAQVGTLDLPLSTATPESRAVIYRNQATTCTAPRTQSNPACNALPHVKTTFGLYPADLQTAGFCAKLQKENLLDPFTVVRKQGDKLVTVPYSKAFAADMKAVSDALKAASATLQGEEALKAYLAAAAQAFLDDNWVPADEAWAAMNATNSKWYLRVAPDEVYGEPCSTKALFHLTLARINPDSLKWQAQLEPVKGEMEEVLAKLSGKPYAARKVSFHLPDFIDIVLNAGDDRAPNGATIGQSLPNFGPVANQGRGRTVAMTNYDAEPDAIAQRIGNARMLLTDVSDMAASPEPLLRSVVLHEAAHNLGPAHQYKVRGKIDRDVFTGPLASMLEELKAQTAAMLYVDFMRNKNMINDAQARQSHTADIVWMFGHIARGMYDENKQPRPYSQLSAIQLGYFVDKGALRWDPAAKAANGSDNGAFTIDHKKLGPVIEELMQLVGGIKARGDKDAALKLLKDYVDVDGDKKKLLDTITERIQRNPRQTYLYVINL